MTSFSQCELEKMKAQAVRGDIFWDQALSQVFNSQIAIGNKTLHFNATTGIKFKRESSKRPPTFPLEEMQKITIHAHDVESAWASIYFVAQQTGCRSGELFRLHQCLGLEEGPSGLGT